MNNHFLEESSCIQTVLGFLLPEKLSHCQCHEHLFIAKGKSYELHPSIYMDDLDRTTRELILYREAGGASLVDAQPIGCGRMAGLLREASIMSGVNVIASTGFHKLVFYPDNHWVFLLNEDRLTRLYIDEIKNGMFEDGDSSLPSIRIDAKPGIIKTALDVQGLEGNYRKLFMAAAGASKETGASLMCHIEKGSEAIDMITFLIGMGVKPESIILSHLDRGKYDLGYHKEIASAGVYLEYDTIGRFKYHSDEEEVQLILGMLEAGFERQLLLGLDTTRERLKSYGGAIGLEYILKNFIPTLKRAGATDKAINSMTRTNPGNALKLNKTGV